MKRKAQTQLDPSAISDDTIKTTQPVNLATPKQISQRKIFKVNKASLVEQGELNVSKKPKFELLNLQKGDFSNINQSTQKCEDLKPASEIFSKSNISAVNIFGNISPKKDIIVKPQTQKNEVNLTNQEIKKDSEIKFQYKDAAKKIFEKKIKKFRLDETEVIHDITVSIQEFLHNSQTNILVRSSITKSILYQGTIVKKLTQIRSFNGKQSNIEVITPNHELKAEKLKFQFENEEDGKQFKQRVSSLLF